MVSIKSDQEIELLRVAGKITGDTHNYLKQFIKPGITTGELDKLAYDFIISQGCTPSFKGYDGFPGTICASVNEEVVHGIPRKDRILKEGDIISLDCGLILNGYHSDAARTYPVGEIAESEKKLIEVTKDAFFEGIKYARAGHHLHEIGNAIGDFCESRGYGVVRDLVGHGIGRQMHEDPQIPNYRMKSRGLRLVAGMTLAIEPMISEGTWEVDWLDDNWTVVTKDRLPAAHYENTILITEDEPEILSKTHD